jgi:hypothetical protein
MWMTAQEMIMFNETSLRRRRDECLNTNKTNDDYKLFMKTLKSWDQPEEDAECINDKKRSKIWENFH